jgi:hypothetical protein
VEVPGFHVVDLIWFKRINGYIISSALSESDYLSVNRQPAIP